ELHRAVPGVARDHVAHVAGEQAIAVLLRGRQPGARARERLGAERNPGRIKRRGHDRERRQGGTLLLDGQRGGQRLEVSREQREKADANATTRRDADSAATDGTIRSQTAANEPMPPTWYATTVTSVVSANDKSTCAPSYRPMRER